MVRFGAEMLAQIATCWYTPTLRRFRRILRCGFDARGLGCEAQSAAGEEYINGRRAEQGIRHVSNSRDHHRVRALDVAALARFAW